MVTKKLIIKNAFGLHMKPAAVLAKAASACSSEVTIAVEDGILNPKSILGIMAAAIQQGTQIELRCDGETEAEDLKRLSELIEGGFEEPRTVSARKN